MCGWYVFSLQTVQSFPTARGRFWDKTKLTFLNSELKFYRVYFWERNVFFFSRAG